MANPAGNPQNLTKAGGNWGNKGGGRPKMSLLKEKEEWLERILSADFDVKTAHPLERRLREIAETSNSSATLEYIYNQKFGSPKTTIKAEVGDTDVFEALGRVLPLHVDKETAKAILNGLYGELSSGDSDSGGAS